MTQYHKEPIEPSAAILKDLFVKNPKEGRQQILELLDLMMEPTHQAFIERREDLAGWSKALFTTEKSFEEWCNKVSVYDKSPLCGCVWTKDFVAYRCKTCATSPCMSVCAACFERGNHEGHEYNIFRSEAGGACDCGDSNVMKASGFCSRHGLNRVVPQDIPPDLLTLPKLMMERMLIMFMHSLRYFVKDAILESSFPSKIPDPICETLEIFMTAIKCGSLIRSWVADMLLSEEYYTKLLENEHIGGVVAEKMIRYHKASHRWVPEAVKRLPMCSIPEEIKNKERFLRSKFVYKNLLQEMMFWVCRFEFPEHLVLFILNMLPDERVKVQFARYFVQHYIFIAPSLSGALHIEEYSNRIVHISVQLFSNSDLAYMLAKEENLLEMFMISMNFMVTSKLINSKMTDDDFHQTVSTSGEGLRNNAYWAIVSDFVNCIGHKAVAKIFLGNDDALMIWMRILTCFTGMNVTTRQSDRHVEYDPQNILLAFYSEREACAAPLWVILDVLRDPTTSFSTKMIGMCKEAIIELLDAMGVDDPKGTGVPFKKLSFHYPVHRYYALFVSNAVSRKTIKLSDLDLDERLARRFMAHPLAILSTVQEIHCQMWVRNGMNISNQQLAYRQSFFCTFFIDADLFMLQLCSHFITPDIFVSSIFDRCRVTNCLTVESTTKPIPEGTHGHDGQPDEERLPGMLEGAFSILLSVLSITTQLGLSDQEIVEQELVAVLSIQNWTYSQLTEHIPQCHDMHGGEKSRRFTEPLAVAVEKLAQKVEGDAMTQTEYALKDEYWQRYSPIFTQLRSLYKKHTQASHTSYFKYLQRNYKLEPGTLESHVWPPYQPIRFTDDSYNNLNKMLNCRTLHTIIFMILYKYLQKHKVISESSLIMAMTLLEGALWGSPKETSEEGQERMEDDSDKPPSSKRPRDEQDWQNLLEQWFSTDNMATNIRHVIDQVYLPSDNPEVFHDAMESSDQLQRQPDTLEDPERCVVIQESILTLLIKLHAKYTGVNDSFVFPAEFVPNVDPPNVIPPTGPNVIERIILLAASKSPENLKIIKSICPIAPTTQAATSDSKTRFEAEKDRRKQKAQEMQQKLLEEFANKQRRFLQQVEMQLDLPGDGEEGEGVAPEEDKFQCVICGAMEDRNIIVQGQTLVEQSSSAKSQIVALIGLAQSSSVLGFRTESGEPAPLVPLDSGVVPPKNCRIAKQSVYENLKKKFPHEEGTYTLGHNPEWEWAPQVSTCGHHVHVTCYQDYMKWVKRDETGYLRFDDGIGFQCPLCRQTSNVIIPCNVQQGRLPLPDHVISQYRPYSPDQRLSPEDQLFQKRLWDVDFAIRTNIPMKTTIIPVTVQPEQQFAGQYPGSQVDPIRMQEVRLTEVDEILKACAESVDEVLSQNKAVLDKDAALVITPRGVLQGELEYELCNFGGTLRSELKPQALSVVKRKIPIGTLFHVIMKTVRAKDEVSNNEFAAKLWSQMSGLIMKIKETNNCPLLLKDPIALLLELCIAIYPFDLHEFQAIVRLMYNVCLIQALAHISCKFSSEERRAWKANISASIGGTPFNSTRLDCLLGLVISCLPRSLFEDSATAKLLSPPSKQHFTSTIWTNQSVHSSLENLLMHFMRISAIFQFSIFKNLSVKLNFHGAPEGQNEFLYLAKYLGMTDGTSVTVSENMCTELAKWPGSPRSTINQWCKEVEVVIMADRATSLQLLTRHRLWKQPSLVFLPEDYTNLFIKFRNITCPQCKYVAREPAVCLMCGQFVCYKGMCQHPRDIYRDDHTVKFHIQPRGAAVHAKKCGNGTIILLLVHNTTIVVVRGTRSCVWGTLYLDQHGEEDRGWKRGRKMMMKSQRLKLLNYQWLNHIFDNACKGWNKHRLQM